MGGMKHVYEIIDDLDSEVYLRKQEEIRKIYQELANQRNTEEQRQQAVRDEEAKLKREFFRKQAEKNISKREQAQQREIEKALEESKEKEKLESSINSASEELASSLPEIKHSAEWTEDDFLPPQEETNETTEN